MSHSTCLVIGENPEEMLAPYSEHLEVEPYQDEDGSTTTYNPQSKWDWYSLGGRWTGFFKLNPDARGVVGVPGIQTKAAQAGYVDQARKRDIDFVGMKADFEVKAISFHARCREALSQQPSRDPQAMRKALLETGVFLYDPVKDLFLNEPDPAASYVEAMTASSGLPYAILNVDGWHEKGRMGWFGISMNEDEDWPILARTLINEAPDSSLFSLYDLHI